MAPQRLAEGLERIGPVFSRLYGQTEGYPISVLRRADHDLAHPELFASCGMPVSSCAVALLDDEGVEVATGEAGEICVRSPAVMEGYRGEPPLTGDWLRTGDVARVDERGYLFIADRKQDMIISGGFKRLPPGGRGCPHR